MGTAYELPSPSFFNAAVADRSLPEIPLLQELLVSNIPPQSEILFQKFPEWAHGQFSYRLGNPGAVRQ